jgi:hypothetical protein
VTESVKATSPIKNGLQEPTTNEHLAAIVATTLQTAVAVALLVFFLDKAFKGADNLEEEKDFMLTLV